MSPREALVTETREWLVRAQADLDACAALIAAGLASEALFHAQQSAEKAVKALLTWNQVAFKKTNVLDELKQACLPWPAMPRSTWPASKALAVRLALPLPGRSLHARKRGEKPQYGKAPLPPPPFFFFFFFCFIRTVFRTEYLLVKFTYCCLHERLHAVDHSFCFSDISKFMGRSSLWLLR